MQGAQELRDQRDGSVAHGDQGTRGGTRGTVLWLIAKGTRGTVLWLIAKGSEGQLR